VRFNISHTEGRVALAFVRGVDLGIDIERIRLDVNVRVLAEQFFSKYERRFLRRLPPEQLHAAFFRCWTRKEAYIKAKGEGLSIPLHQFDVSLTPGQPAELLGTRPDRKEASRWELYDLPIECGYAAALVVGRSHESSTLMKEQLNRT